MRQVAIIVSLPHQYVIKRRIVVAVGIKSSVLIS